MLTLAPENVKQQEALEFSTDNFTQQSAHDRVARHFWETKPNHVQKKVKWD